jgi:hypothetical protein
VIRAIFVAIVVAGGAVVSAQQPSLRVVVVAGEDAVNIIQQKTAVRPVVEVRDRNNLPVSGALVTFSIEGGHAATFGGASTLTVATNAAGQAAVTGLTPSAAGAFQIQVSAAFQGQIATATIAQTNVLTAAQAAAAGAASSGAGGSAGGSAGGTGGAAGGAGGGMSATTIGVVGAAVAGGAVAATQVAGKGDEDQPGKQSAQVFTGSISGPASESVTSRSGGQNCTITRSITATVTANLSTNDPASVNGDMQITGTGTVTQSSCAAVNQSNPFGGSVPLTGPPSAIRGSSTNASTGTGQSGEAISGTSTVTFQGSLGGNTLAGTVTFESQSQSNGGSGGPVDSQQFATFPVTLTKS